MISDVHHALLALAMGTRSPFIFHSLHGSKERGCAPDFGHPTRKFHKETQIFPHYYDRCQFIVVMVVMVVMETPTMT